MQHTPCPAAELYRNPNASPIHSTNASQRPSTPLIPSHQSICSGRFTASPLVAGTSTCSCFGVSSFYHCPLSAPGSKPPAPSKAPVLPFRHSLKAKTAGDPKGPRDHGESLPRSCSNGVLPVQLLRGTAGIISCNFQGLRPRSKLHIIHDSPPPILLYSPQPLFDT